MHTMVRKLPDPLLPSPMRFRERWGPPDQATLGWGEVASTLHPQGPVGQPGLRAPSESALPPAGFSQSLEEGLIFPRGCRLQGEGIHHGKLWVLGPLPLMAPQGLAYGVLGKR